MSVHKLVTLSTADMTAAQLVDALGVASAEESVAVKRRKAIRDAIEALGDGTYDGMRYRATVKTSPSTRVVPELVRELLSADDVALVSVTSDSTRVTCTALNGRD